MGNEQRKYGRELHTNEFDVVPECQRRFCKRFIFERLIVQLGVRVFVVIFGAWLARFSQRDVGVPTRCHEAGKFNLARGRPPQLVTFFKRSTMRFFRLPLVVLFLLFFAFASQSRANSVPIRGGSTYGNNPGYSICVDNINTLSTDNCEAFSLTSFTIGGNSYSGGLFAFLEPGGAASGILDIIQLGANSSLTLNLINPSPSGPTGVFMCGSFGVDSNVAQDSSVPPLPLTGLPCTPGSSPSTGSGYSGTLDLADVQANFTATGVTFVNLTSSPIAVFTEDGNIQGATGVPEPGSLMLLGVGLLAVGRKFRRVK
jgi:hypothetical protein